MGVVILQMIGMDTAKRARLGRPYISLEAIADSRLFDSAGVVSSFVCSECWAITSGPCWRNAGQQLGVGCFLRTDIALRCGAETSSLSACACSKNVLAKLPKLAKRVDQSRVASPSRSPGPANEAGHLIRDFITIRV